MRNPITTRVEIDGLPAPVYAADLDAGLPTVLDALEFSWGRESTVDQPDTGTCSFVMREQLNRDDSQTILDAARVGSSVEVWASAEIPATHSEVMTWTSFANFPAGPLSTNYWSRTAGSTPTALTVGTFGGLKALILDRGFATWTSGIMFPPAAFVPAGTQPDAWDGIARLQPGRTWLVSVTAKLPLGADARPSAWGLTGPYSTNPVTLTVVGPDGQEIHFPADEEWHTLTGTVTLPADYPNPDGVWIAPGIRINPMPSQLTWTGTDPQTWNDQGTRTWEDLRLMGISRLSVTQSGPADIDALVWAGEITGVVGQAAGDHAVTISVTASDAGAVLGNTTIGDEPWPVQTAGVRIARILALTRGEPAMITDPTLAGVQLSYKDVDAQPVLGLLQDIAQSVGGVFWVATHAVTGPYLWMEDPNRRTSVRRFQRDMATGLVIITGNTDDVSLLSARDVLRDPVQWAQDVSQVITTVDVGWQFQTVDEDGQAGTEERTYTVADEAAVDLYGVRNLSVSTDLINEVAAASLAQTILTQSRAVDWRVSGYSIDTATLHRNIPTVDYVDRLQMIMDLLDGTTRIGRAVTLIEVPDYTPAGAVASGYVEGGTFRMENWRWQLDLNISPSGGAGESATWQDMDDAGNWTWQQMDPNVAWIDAYGVAGPA